jgi:superfamily I DNA/RNA helicase
LTGKTTYLLTLIEQLLLGHMRPERIALFTFTRKAAAEGIERASERFSLNPAAFKHIRTIHSMAYRQTKASPQRTITKKHMAELAQTTGFEFRGVAPEGPDDIEQQAGGDVLFFLENLARVTEVSLDEVWNTRALTHMDPDLSLQDLHYFAERYRAFKAGRGLQDYTDVLMDFAVYRKGNLPEIDVLFVDEAQDLSSLQWRAIERIAERVPRIIIAFDEDQAIHRWAGADIDYVLDLEGTVRVLNQSYRIPRTVHTLSDVIIQRIGRRRPKQFQARDAEGSVTITNHPSELDASKDSWLFLARHQYQLETLKALCEDRGWFYTCNGKASNASREGLAIVAWESLRKGIPTDPQAVQDAARYARKPVDIDSRADFVGREAIKGVDWATARPWFEALVSMDPEKRDYIRYAMRNGEKIISPPRITISTIHGSKGGQADGVYLLPDVSESTYRALEQGSDDEHRVFYVGVTRVKDRLVIAAPESQLYYPLEVTECLLKAA